MIFLTLGSDAHVLNGEFIFGIGTEVKLFLIPGSNAHILWDDLVLIPKRDAYVLLINGELTGRVRVKCAEVLSEVCW